MIKFNELTKRLKKLHWVWFWSGNWPLLDSLMAIDHYFQDEFERMAGIRPVCTVAFFKKGITTVYHSEQNYKRLRQYFLSQFKKDSAFMLSYYEDYDERIQNIIQELKAMVGQDLGKLTGKELAKLWEKKRQLYAPNAVMDFFAWYMEFFFVPVLQQWVEPRLTKFDQGRKLAEVMVLLVTPRKGSIFFEEQRSLLRLVAYAVKHSTLRKQLTDIGSTGTILAIDRAFKKRAEEHHKKFCWVSMLVNNPATSVDQIVADVAKFVKDPETCKIKSRRLGDNFIASEMRKKETWIKKLRPPAHIRALIEDLEVTAYIRTQDNAYQGKITHTTLPLYLEVAKRLRISYIELKELSDYDVLRYLNKGQAASKKLIQARLQLSCMVGVDDRVDVFEQREATAIQRIVVPVTESKDQITFSGTAACAGSYRGEVRVCASSKDAYDLREGEVLIAPATSADFVPAMRRAGAIITEFGGITSHAAVVSREFGIACIVGVQKITKILKTGDHVEVDATRGIIKKL